MGLKQYRTDPLTEREKAYLRRKNGIKSRFAADTPKVETTNKDREYYAPVKAQWSPPKKRPGRMVLSSDLRKIVEAKRAARDEFIAALRRGK